MDEVEQIRALFSFFAGMWRTIALGNVWKGLQWWI
jgi:hypothetical protein